MARSRNIKPGFFINEDLAECGIDGQMLFAGLWCWADREGRLEDRPKRLKAQILPFHDGIDVDALLTCLHEQKLIVRYHAEENSYIQIVNFKKHQNPHQNETPSTIPAPENTGALSDMSDHGPKSSDTNRARSLILDPREEPNNISSVPTETEQQTSLIDVPIFITIPLKKTGKSFSVDYDQLSSWKAAYPNLDVEQQLRNLQQWNINNPTKRKTERGIGKHITGWLSREASKAQGKRPAGQSAVDAVEAANREKGTKGANTIQGESTRVE